MWWKEYNLYVAFRCWVQFVRWNKIVVVLWRIVYIEWSMNNAKCMRQSFTAGQSLPPGFSCRTWMFWCKEIVVGQVFVPHGNVFVAKKLLSRMFVSHVPLSMKSCTKNLYQYFKEEQDKFLHPLRMITGPKECCTEIFRQICARTSKYFFNKQTRYSN